MISSKNWWPKVHLSHCTTNFSYLMKHKIFVSFSVTRCCCIVVTEYLNFLWTSDVQGTCKYGTRVDYILASPNSPYKFVPGSYTVISSKGTSDHHIVKVDVTIQDKKETDEESGNQRQRVVKINKKCSKKGLWAAKWHSDWVNFRVFFLIFVGAKRSLWVAFNCVYS